MSPPPSQIFERVEAECARRAEEEAVVEQERVEAQEEAERSQMQAEADDDVPSPVSPSATITAAATRQRRRGSVSVSRFGMVSSFLGVFDRPVSFALLEGAALHICFPRLSITS